jgi:hypothetical protein
LPIAALTTTEFQIMTITLLESYAFDGPNRHRPQPCVLFHILSNFDATRKITTLLKDAAQRAGIILVQLALNTQTSLHGSITSVIFTTPTPRLAAKLGPYVVAALQAEQSADETWDGDAILLSLQQQRRAEALPLAALQLMAEAAARSIPAFRRTDQALQIGYGQHGRRVPYGIGSPGEVIMLDSPGNLAISPANPPELHFDWAGLARIPIVAFSGEDRASSTAATRFALRRAGAWHAITQAGFDQARDALSDPHLAQLAVALAAGDLLQRGLPFEQCAACAIIGMPNSNDPTAMAESIGLPLLVTDPAGVAALDADTPAIVQLAEYAACPIVWFSQNPTTIARPLVICMAGRIVGLSDATSTDLGNVQAGMSLAIQLAAAALDWRLPPVT